MSELMFSRLLLSFWAATTNLLAVALLVMLVPKLKQKKRLLPICWFAVEVIIVYSVLS